MPYRRDKTDRAGLNPAAVDGARQGPRCTVCGTATDPRLGWPAHPCCAPDRRLPPGVEDAVAAWLASVPTAGPLPPWPVTEPEAPAAPPASSSPPVRAVSLAGLEALAAATRVTGAQARARLGPVRIAPPGITAEWPPGTIGAAANRERNWR